MSSQSGAMLNIFEDNEAVIKIIIKGRSPTMRHVSRTHRVALDWLFDRINLDPKIQIKYIDTKNQLADILTKGNFTRDEWNHLLHLFNISMFSSASCPEAMSKRMQQGTGEERIVAKSKPTLNLVSRFAASSPTAPSSSASSRPGIHRAPSQQGSNLIDQPLGVQNDAASIYQVWLTDAMLSERARRLAAAGTNQGLSFQESARKLAAENSEIIVDDDSEWPDNFHISRAYVPHLQKIFSNRQNGRPRCEYIDKEIVYDCHSATRSSSWKRLFGESTFHQKSATTNSETIVRCDKEVGQGSERNPRHIRDPLATRFLEKDDFVN